jgi:putative ABC transport system permease protein
VIGARRVEAFVLGALPREAGGLEVPDGLAVGDVATVQELSGRLSGVDRVELRISGAAGARTLAAVSEALPAGVRLERAGSRSDQLERALAAFRANLRALSFLALFVGIFLIYNGVLLSVLRRRGVLGVARCLGATRGQVLGAWMLEALLVGVVGTAAGLALGAAFAAPALREVAGTARSLYGAVGTASVRLDAGILVRGAAVGLACTLASALVPALEAAGTAPAHTSSRSGVERRSRARRRGALAAAVPLLAVAAAAAAWPSTSAAPGYVAAAALALGAALVVPAALDLLLRLLLASGFAGPGGVVRLAAAGLRGSLSRTGVAVAALTVALAMSVAMGALVGSFRGELVRWIEGSVRADVYVSPAALEVDREGAALPADLQATLAALPGAAEVTSYRERPVRLLRGVGAGRPPIDTHLAAVDVAVLRRRADWPVMDGLDPAAFFDGLAGGGAGVSEALHRRTGLARGDSVRVRLGGRMHELPVAGVYREYGSETGLVLVDRAAFPGTPDLGPPRSLGVFLQPGADPDAFAETVRRGARGLALTVRTREELRARALSVFDRTFAITRALEVAALCVAAVGILGALLSILLERGRELAVLRALGATRGQLAGTFFVESTVLASLAWLFALAAGAALAWILIAVVNVRSFGWALPYRVPLGAWSTALLASLLASWAATLWPARRVARLPVAALLRDE